MYLDSSAIVKLVVAERETEALSAYIGSAELVTSDIAEVEVPRASFLQTGSVETLAHAYAVLRRFTLIALDDDLRDEAARARPPELRTLDAIHLVSALRIRERTDAIVIYDRRLGTAAKAARLRVAAPGLAR